MKTIKKPDFVALVAEELGSTKVEAERAINAYHKVAAEQLSTPDTTIALQGVWTLSSAMTKPRTMVNQLSETKETIEVPSKLKVKAKVSPAFAK